MLFPTHFAPAGTTDIQQNIELALYVLRHIEQRRDPQQRIWIGERGLRTLQYACHVLEALHQLNLRGLTNHLAEPAVNWLLALPLDLPPEDLRGFRLFPGRFKTLAQLGRFDAARLMPDFDLLTRHFDPAGGWIHDAPVDVHPTLATMLWVDTLQHLHSQGPLPPELQSSREQALRAIAATLTLWVDGLPAAAANQSAGLRPGDLTGPADASYALELLCRAGHLAPDAPAAEAARQHLTAGLSSPPPTGQRPTDRLYCAIHLQLCYPQTAATRDAVQGLLREVRQRYAADDCQREPLAYHALVLRLLATGHGDALRTGMLERLWRNSLAAVEAREREEQEQLEAEFTGLIRQSIRVQLTPPQRLTGTRARGEVYRVRFGLTTESTDERGSPLSTPRDTLRLIVKKGSPEVLARSIERYHALPQPLQRLFARHADLPAAEVPGYLIMQDLADMQPLSEILGQLDRPVLLADERARDVAAVAGAVAQAMQALHAYERRPTVIGHQLDVVYLGPMARALERLAQPTAFPELQPWLTGPITANRRKYREIDWYLHRLRRYQTQLNPTSLGYVHGDCHSRNLMLNRDLAAARFVDIDNLTSADDYMLDYGLLLEDVAVYQSLPYGPERGRVEWDDIQVTRPRGPAQPGEKWIAYPAFPRSEAMVLFQTELLQRLRAFAESAGDVHWQPRLWLAVARGLLLLASHQMTGLTVEPQRRQPGPRYVNDVRLVQVTYAEAVRLLRELVDHLNPRRGARLPELPFPGLHRPSTAGPHTARVARLLAGMERALGQAAERRAVPEQPALVDYVTQPGHVLFARVFTDDQAPVLYLAGQPDQMHDPRGLARPMGPEDAPVMAAGLGSRVALNSPGPLADIIQLARQAHQWASREA